MSALETEPRAQQAAARSPHGCGLRSQRRNPSNAFPRFRSKARGAAAAALFGLLLSGCSNDSEEDESEILIEFAVSTEPTTVRLKPGEAAVVQISIRTIRGKTPASSVLPWRRTGGHSLASKQIAEPLQTSTTLTIVASSDPRLLQFNFESNQSPDFIHVGPSRAPRRARVYGGGISIVTDFSEAVGPPPTREDKEFKGPKLAFGPEVLNFGDLKVDAGFSRAQSIRVSNIGKGDLAVSIRHGGDSAHFTPFDRDISLKAGRAQVISYNFNPASTGAKNMQIFIGSNDRDATIQLFGNGIP